MSTFYRRKRIAPAPKMSSRKLCLTESEECFSTFVKDREDDVEMPPLGSYTANKVTQNQFWPLLVLFHLFGIATVSHVDLNEEISGKLPWKGIIKRLRCFIWNCPKHIIRIILFMNVLARILWIMLLQDKTIQLASVFQATTLTVTYFIIYRNRQVLLKSLKIISELFQALSPDYDFRKYRYFVVLYFLYCQFLSVSISILYSSTNEKLQIEIYLINSTLINDYFKLPQVLFAGEMLFNFALGGIVALFVLHYSFICNFVNKLLSVVLSKLKKSSGQDLEYLLTEYGNILKAINSLEKSFSGPAFATVLNNTVGLFVVGYNLSFTSNSSYGFYLYSTLLGLQHLTFQLMIMLFGASTVEAATEAKRGVLALPGRIPSRYHALKIAVRRRFKRDSVLTLWNIYVLDRSLLVSSFASLITYGILIGTLGKVQNAE